MNRRIRCKPVLAATLLAGLLLAPAMARADTLDTLLDILVNAGVVDGAVKDAKPLIACLIAKKNATACVNVKSLAEQQGKQAVKKFTPSDPAIVATIEIVQAAYASDWIKVLEVTGADLLVQIACKAGLSSGGPLKNFICGSVFKEVSHLAKPALRQVLITVNHPTPGNLLSLIGVIDPALACKVVPDFPGKGEVCGIFGTVLVKAEKFAKDMAKLGMKGADALENFVFGDDSHMPYDKYYALYWQPWYHYGTWLCLTKNCQGLGNLNASIGNPCVDYFDSHNQYRSTARKTCGDMRNKFDREVKAFAKAMPPVAEGQVEATRPSAKLWAFEDYGKDKLTQRKDLFVGLCSGNLTGKFPFPHPNPVRCEIFKQSPMYKQFKSHFDKAYANCRSAVAKQMPSPTAWSSACTQVVNRFAGMYYEERVAIGLKLKKLAGAGCVQPKNWPANKGIMLECSNYAGFQQCNASFGLQFIVAPGKSTCNVDQKLADEKLAKTLVAQLGAKRCERTKAGNGQVIACARPWKHDQCKTLLAAAKQGIPLTTAVGVQCQSKDQLKSEPAFSVVSKQAQDILNTLNGVKKMGGGLVMVPPMKACKHGLDPLTISCPGNPKALGEMGVKLPTCPPDPNKDGADVPCYTGPYSAGGTPPMVKAGAPLPGTAPMGKTTDVPASRRSTPVAGIATITRGLPDLVSTATFTIGGRLAMPGGSVRLDAAQAQQRGDGLCTFVIQHGVRNTGTAPAPAYTTEWQGTARGSVTQHRPALVAGGSAAFTDTVALRPGQSALMLRIDSAHTVPESNERNNDFRLTIQLSGDCAAARAAPGTPPPPAGRRLHLPSR